MVILFVVVGCVEEPTVIDPPPTGSTDTATVPMDEDGDGFNNDDDCNDTDPDIYPGADEHCDNLDEDCDGLVDEDPVDRVYYRDQDGDGAGAGTPVAACQEPDGYASDGDDCDDENAARNPYRDEACNGIDDDCDPATTEDGIVTRGIVVGGEMFEIQTYEGFALALQWAVDDLGSGQAVHVCPGTYVGVKVWDDPDTVQDEWPSHIDEIVIEGRDGADVTFIEGNFDFAPDGAVSLGPQYDKPNLPPKLTLRGLTLSNPTGRGVSLEVNNPDVTLEDCAVSDNADSGLYLSTGDGSVTLTRTTFERNIGVGGGAIGGEQGRSIDIVGTDLVFTDNEALEYGGAVSVDAGTFTCTNCSFSGNVLVEGDSVRYRGSAIHTAGSTVLDQCIFSDNAGSTAIHVYGGTVDVVDTVFSGNQGVSGGAIYVDTLASASVAGGSFDGNGGTVIDAAIWFDPYGTTTLVVDGSNFGNATTLDVYLEDYAGGLSYDYTGVSSFTCDFSGCSDE